MKIRKDREVFLQPTPYPKCLFLAKRPSFDLRNRIGTNRRNNRKLVTLLDGHMSHIEKQNELKKTLLKFL
jgi:translation initiation factor 1 (eIF-1/SUI1)